MKKEWEKPKLVVLVRGKPEEAVLGWCKLETFLSYGPDDQGCGWHFFEGWLCERDVPS